MTEHRLEPGDAAPEFTLPDADGNSVSLSSYRGRRVIVYFYPAAMTPGCTKEAVGFQDQLKALDTAGVESLSWSWKPTASLVQPGASSRRGRSTRSRAAHGRTTARRSSVRHCGKVTSGAASPGSSRCSVATTVEARATLLVRSPALGSGGQGAVSWDRS